MTRLYGTEDTSFQAAGGEEGLLELVDAFYRVMDEWPGAARIRKMHPRDLTVSRDKLARFLCGWLGGPKRFSERYGPIKIPAAHAHLPVNAADRDAWLECMRRAVAEQPYADDFRIYLLEQLAVPAERVRMASEKRRAELVSGSRSSSH